MTIVRRGRPASSRSTASCATPTARVKRPRYYQEIAVNRAVQAVIQGRKRILLTMATGTGKTFVALQIVWKLWKTRRKRRILYLADRNILVDQAKDRTFAPFGDAAAQDPAPRGQEPRDLLRHLPGHRRPRRRPAGPLPALSARLLRPDHRRRVPPGQRPRREQLAADPGVLRPRHADRHDRHAAAQRQRRHLPLLWRPGLHLQPGPGHRRRLPGAIPGAADHHRRGCRRLAARSRPAGPLWPRGS